MTKRPTPRLGPEDWIAAGFRALAENGPQALKAEPLARALGTSKGSFYWHFKDVPAFHAAMMQLWQDKAVTEIISSLTDLPTPQDKLRHLARLASGTAPERFGGARVEPAIRAWALQSPLVAEGVAKVDAERIAYVADLLAACDRPGTLAPLFYAAYIGLDDLEAKHTPGVTGMLPALIDMILR